MSILDDDQNKLSLWENDQEKIYLEVGPSDNEDAPFYTGFITLTTDDARALIGELTRLVKGIEAGPQKEWMQLKLTPEQPLTDPQKQSKINFQ